MSDIQLDEPLRDKIRRRAARAFEAFDNKPKPCALCGHLKDEVKSEKFHRITEVTKSSLKYRVRGSLVGKCGSRSGPRVTIRRDKKGRISVPKKIKL